MVKCLLLIVLQLDSVTNNKGAKSGHSFGGKHCRLSPKALYYSDKSIEFEVQRPGFELQFATLQLWVNY